MVAKKKPLGAKPTGTRAVASGTPKPPAVPAGYHQVHIPDAKADADYKYQVANLNKQQADYNVQHKNELSQYNTTYNQNLTDLGYDTVHKKWNPHDTVAGTYGAAVRDTTNDYASRGMGYSTPYVQATQNMQRDYNRRLGAQNNNRAQFIQTQGDQATQYAHSNQAAKGTALRDAVSRIASQYGVQPTQVKPGTVRNINVKNP